MEKKINDFLILVESKKQETVEDKIGFSSNIFTLFGLPIKQVADPIWKKENSLYKFVIINENYEVPYGCYARMNQIFIDTEIIQKKNEYYSTREFV